jgi:hypothetical protein
MITNKFLIASLFSLTVLAACQTKEKGSREEAEDSANQAMLNAFNAGGPVFISPDSANRMISSYLNSIGSTSNDSNLTSLIINADSLRAYLYNTNIKHVKIMFAHKLSYINAGRGGQNAGFSKNALTAILVGFDASDNYIYNDKGQVMDNMTPCPHNCPSSGTAANNTLQ